MRAKLATPDHDIHELLRRRWSPRAFDERIVERRTLLRLIEALRWAPSSFNEQPWRLVLATKANAAEFERLLGCLNEGNRIWARHAAMLGLSVAKLRFDRTQRPNRHAFHDVGLAMENLVVQATALGIGVHQMAGFDVEAARAAYAIPEGFEPVVAFALGYPGAPEQHDERDRDRELTPRTRLPITAIAFRGTWGNSLKMDD